MKLMAIKKGDKVKVDYTGTLEDGKVFDTSKHEGHEHPLEFTVGENQVIKGFDEAVIGMNKGDKKTINLQPKDAYGLPNEQLIQQVPSEQLPPEAKEGSVLGMKLPEGQTIPVKIVKISDGKATVDFNHPLAGKTLKFDIEIIDVVSA